MGKTNNMSLNVLCFTHINSNINGRFLIIKGRDLLNYLISSPWASEKNLKNFREKKREMSEVKTS